jgi:hypothetical protein
MISISTNDAALALKASVTKVKNEIKAGNLIASKNASGHHQIEISELVAFVEKKHAKLSELKDAKILKLTTELSQTKVKLLAQLTAEIELLEPMVDEQVAVECNPDEPTTTSTAPAPSGIKYAYMERVQYIGKSRLGEPVVEVTVGKAAELAFTNYATISNAIALGHLEAVVDDNGTTWINNYDLAAWDTETNSIYFVDKPLNAYFFDDKLDDYIGFIETRGRLKMGYHELKEAIKTKKIASIKHDESYWVSRKSVAEILEKRRATLAIDVDKTKGVIGSGPKRSAILDKIFGWTKN